MITSSLSRNGTSVFSVGSTTAAGTIIQTVRGDFSLLAKSSNDVVPTAPSLARDWTASAWRS